MRLTKAVIHTNNLKKNFLNIRKKVGKVKVMAVVKADAYGHGVKIVLDTLNSLGKQKPEYYAVATPDEGVELRKLKIKQPILIFDPIDKYQVSKFFKFNLIPSVFTKQHLNILLKEKKRLKS
ncbi:MAG TPA: alanine racemase, partial [Ignavibacteriaceae bacterium]